MPNHGNLLYPLPAPGAAESFEALLDLPGVRVERIVSHRHASPPDFWYDQPEAEWVMVVQGEAVIAFDDGREHAMRAGDWLTIPPRCRHRVAATGEATVWLAVHIGLEASSPGG